MAFPYRPIYFVQTEAVQRVSIVGNSGSGKSTLGRRIASAIDAPYIELDDIHHLEHWAPIDPALFMQQVTAVCSRSRWVIDGNYRRVTVDGPIWEHADTVIWLHLPRRIVMHQIIRRTIRRVSTREEQYRYLRFIELRSHAEAENLLLSLAK